MKPRPPSFLAPRATELSAIAARHGLRLVGPDRVISAYGPISTSGRPVEELLTYATSPEYLSAFIESDIAACVVHESLARELPIDRSALIHVKGPAESFYSIFAHEVEAGEWTSLSTYRGSNNKISASASIAGEGVVIGDNCVILDNAVIHPQTYISDDVVIEANATIGGNGFQLAEIAGHRRRVPHAGGVFLGDRVSVGSSTCIDRGLFGEFTHIECDTHIDNLVHIAHSARIGRDVAIVACAEISGSVVVGDGAWLAPGCAINPGLHVGDHALIGTGSTVVGDIPPHAIAYGSPARVRGARCTCGKSFGAEGVGRRCEECGWSA